MFCCAVFLPFNVLHFCITARSILLDRLLCALRGCASIMACFVLVHNVIVAAAEALADVNMLSFIFNQFKMFLCLRQGVLWLLHLKREKA